MVEFNPEKHYCGKPCVKCGSDARYISNNGCVRCQREGYNRRRSLDPEKENQRIYEWAKRNDYYRNYRENNRDKVRKNQRNYEKRNAEKIRERKSEWRENNPDYSSNWYEENKERVKENVQRWKEKNAQKVRDISRARKARKRSNGGSYTVDEWVSLCSEYENKCLCCKKKKKLQADHIIPVAKGGTSYIWNIQPLCKKCNLAKHTQIIDYRPIEDIPIEFKRELKKILAELDK